MYFISDIIVYVYEVSFEVYYISVGQKLATIRFLSKMLPHGSENGHILFEI